MGQNYPEWANTMKLARAYVRPQRYTQRFNPLEGLQHGTIFPELVDALRSARRGAREHEEASRVMRAPVNREELLLRIQALAIHSSRSGSLPQHTPQ